MDPSPAPVVIRRAPAKPAPYIPAIGPWLRIVLWTVFAGFAFLGATGVYLSAVRVLNFALSPNNYTTPFALWVFFSHIVLGVAGTLPFVAFGAYHWWTARNRKPARWASN